LADRGWRLDGAAPRQQSVQAATVAVEDGRQNAEVVRHRTRLTVDQQRRQVAEQVRVGLDGMAEQGRDEQHQERAPAAVTEMKQRLELGMSGVGKRPRQSLDVRPLGVVAAGLRGPRQHAPNLQAPRREGAAAQGLLQAPPRLQELDFGVAQRRDGNAIHEGPQRLVEFPFEAALPGRPGPLPERLTGEDHRDRHPGAVRGLAEGAAQVIGGARAQHLGTRGGGGRVRGRGAGPQHAPQRQG
jgi:hypothetical protein